jgi:hypothetical protein
MESKGNRLAISGAREASVASSIGREHGVDDDAADRDIEPNRKRESGQAPVRGKATAEREEKSDENHRKGHDRETDVRDEQREVDLTNRALALKAHVAVEGVIGDVGDEEKGGKDKRREHGRPVLADVLNADETETGDEGDGGEGVEQSVECRKEEQVGAGNIGGCVIINEPAEEKAGYGADGDNSGDDAERGTFLVARECRHGIKAKIIAFLLLPTISEFACFRDLNGRQHWRSTTETNEKKARQIAQHHEE